jgi:hypothetical protein
MVLPGWAQTPPGEPRASRERQLWEQIEVLKPQPLATQPYAGWFVAARARAELLQQRAHLYLTLYPGGAHRDEAVQLELNSLFELGALHGGTIDRLCDRVTELLRAPPSPAAAAEAAYWAIQCRRGSKLGTTSQPATAAMEIPDADLLDAYHDYLQQYPASRYAPRLAEHLFEDAQRRGDNAAMTSILEQMRAHFPHDATTTMLKARWRRATAVGELFSPELKTLDGHALDWREYAGHPVLVVVWAGFDAGACAEVEAVERLRSAHPDMRVIGINLDDGPDEAVAASRRLGIDWPQCNDGLSWGGEFARTWGVERIPTTFVLDRAGRLLGVAEGAQWATLAERALEEGRK